MDKIKKALARLTEKERAWIKDILSHLLSNDLSGLDIKKLKGRNDIFRVRKRSIRIIYRKDNNGVFILSIERRNETTYK